MFVRLLKNKLIIDFKIRMEISGRKVTFFFMLVDAEKQKIARRFDQKKACFLPRILNLRRMRWFIRFRTRRLCHQDQHRTTLARTFRPLIINARNKLHMHHPTYRIITLRTCQQIH